MTKRELIKFARILSAAIFFIMLPLAPTACSDDGGADTTSGSSIASTRSVNTGAGLACDKTAPSIIPKPSDRPQLVYFFRDT